MLNFILTVIKITFIFASIILASFSICAQTVLVDGVEFDDFKKSLSAIKDGSTVFLTKGVYKEGAYITSSNISILGESGVVFDGATVDEKAAFVFTGRNIVVESIECRNIRVRDGNGACIRFEGENLTVRDLYVHDSESGIMTSGSHKGFVDIAFSRFERLGNRNGYAHAMYIIADQFTLRYSQVTSTKDQGSGIKSRAKKVVIENSLLASLEGVDSRLIDMASYGELIVRDSILQEGPKSSNSQMISYGLEKNVTKNNPINRIELRNNLIFFDRNINVLIAKRLDGEFINRGNIFIGDFNHVNDIVPGNEWYFSRKDASLEDYPYLPSLDEREEIMTFVRLVGSPKR